MADHFSGGWSVHFGFICPVTPVLGYAYIKYTIGNATVAMDWVQSNFPYNRACTSLQNYNMIKAHNDNEVEHKPQTPTELINCSDHENNNNTTSKPKNEIMAKYSISFEIMNLYMQLKGTERLDGMLRIFTRSKEFEHITFRQSDKGTLNSLNKNRISSLDTIRFPIEEGINTRETKINCLLQATFGTLKITNGLLSQDAYKIIFISTSLAKALREITFRGTMFECARSACLLAQCVTTKLWEQSKFVSKLVPRIGLVLSGHLVSNGKTTLQLIRDTDPRELERILNRNPPFGNYIHNFIRQIPKYKVQASFDEYLKLLILKISLMDYCNISKTVLSHTISILVGDSENCLLKAHQICNEEFLEREGIIDMTVSLKNKCFSDTFNYTVIVCLISDQWNGIDVEIKLKLGNREEYIKESISEETDNCIEATPLKVLETLNHYKRKKEISINEEEKKKEKMQINIKKYLHNVSSKKQNQDPKVINELRVVENKDNIKKCCANESRVATHTITGEMIGIITNNNNNDDLNKNLSYEELMNDDVFRDLFVPDDNYVISETFDSTKKYCFRENEIQPEYLKNNTLLEVNDPIQLQCSIDVFPNEDLGNDKSIIKEKTYKSTDFNKYTQITNNRNKCSRDKLLENKENVNPNKLERPKELAYRILSSSLFNKQATQAIHKPDVKTNNFTNDSVTTNRNMFPQSIPMKEKVLVNDADDNFKSCKAVPRSEDSSDFLATKNECSRRAFPAAGGRLTRLIDTNLKVTSDFYASHKQISQSIYDGGSSRGEKVVCNHNDKPTKSDDGRRSKVSGRDVYRHRLSSKVTLDKFFRASKYSHRFKDSCSDRLVTNYDPTKYSWVCGDGGKWRLDAVKRLEDTVEPLQRQGTSLGDLVNLSTQNVSKHNEYNQADPVVSSSATVTTEQDLCYDLPTTSKGYGYNNLYK